MLADAKHPVTFWAEAVNTACYVQNRVLVNNSQNKTPCELFNSRNPAIGFLRPFRYHVMILNTLDHLGKFDAKGDEDLLKNKLIEKGTGPNWLFNIDTLTNSMKYVLVVVTGTSSTNISAHMESSNNNAQDACNADAPESSRTSNPTATSKSPPAEQMESLTVESAIPTVSSHVLTTCLDTSPGTTSGLRLISKEVFSQEETPSLDNILTLLNRFKDILGDTTHTIDINGVEADLRNMESIIPVSPTPTFKIHKDHPKSQIIGPVDTPVQTRHKSKEMEEHSFIATIHQKTTPNLLQFCLFSCFLSQEEPKKIFDALKDPNPKFPDRVYKVEKAMYGLHQAPRAWYALMHDKFQMSAMGELNLFLGLQVLQKKDGIFLSQDKYVGDILKKFGYSDVRSMIGSLMYLTASRPDIMFAVCACARHKECHLYAVKRIFRYLKGHPKLGLWYPKESLFNYVAYSDSDYGGAIQDRKSTIGGCQFLGRRLIS
uniref:Reverse transcriptase Ty1/copia-type domain-containing protein n=1 Tax=Tanacetum cinerariifolium TaxID=118510 RepID=A0A699JJ00_TANCI|nr:hypothetical protein [Tanacetum cinerariifolium]